MFFLPISIRLCLYTSLLPQSVRLFALLSSDAVPFCFRFRSLARSRLDYSCSISALIRSFSHVDGLFGPVATLLHFGSRMISLTHQLPSDQTGTMWLVVLGWDHRNHDHAIKVWQIYIYIYTYIHTNTKWLHCMISSLTLRCSAINTQPAAT